MKILISQITQEPTLSWSLEVKGCFFRFISVLNTGGKVQIYFAEQAPPSKVQPHG